MLTDAAFVNVVIVADATVCPDGELTAARCFQPSHFQSLAAYGIEVQIQELQLIAQSLCGMPENEIPIYRILSLLI